MREQIIKEITDTIIRDYKAQQDSPGTPEANFSIYPQYLLNRWDYHRARQELGAINREALDLGDEEIDEIKRLVRESVGQNI